MNTKVKVEEKSPTQTLSLQDSVIVLSQELALLRSTFEIQENELYHLKRIITDNYADLVSQIDSIESTASEALDEAESAYHQSSENSSDIGDLQSQVEETVDGLHSLESDVSDIILTGNDK